MSQEVGKLISIEGIDGSGKKTQARLLFQKLKRDNHKCEIINIPFYDSPSGRIVGQCYLGMQRKDWLGDKAWFEDPDKVDPKIASLYYAANRSEVSNKIKNLINHGFIVILDRWVESNMGHQAGKATSPEDCQKIIDFIEKLEYGLLELPKPDLTIFLHMPSEVSLELIKQRGDTRDGHENLNHIKNAEDSYIKLSEIKQWKTIKCAPDLTMGSLRAPEDIAEEIYNYIRDLL